MAINNKYFYFRMKADFFEESAIFNMEEVPEFGKDLIITLLKLYCISIKDHGCIKIPVHKNLQSQNMDDKFVIINTLAKRCRISNSMMELCLGYYLQEGLIDIAEEKGYRTVNVNYVINNTGTGSKEGDRKRAERALMSEKKIPQLEDNSLAEKPTQMDDETYQDLMEQYNWYKKASEIKGKPVESFEQFIKNMQR